MFGHIKRKIIDIYYHVFKIDEIKNEIFKLYRQNIELNRKIKNLYNNKITIVFVCHRPQLWDSLKTIYDACMKDSDFNVIIVAIPNKKQIPKLGLNHEIYESEGAESFFENYKCKVIHGYDYEENKWFDLSSLKPDYLFFQTPYDICRPMEYRSDEITKYTRICFVQYGAAVIGEEIMESSNPQFFLKNTSYIFAESIEKEKFYKKIVDISPNRQYQKILYLGFPRFDNLEEKLTYSNCSWKNEYGKRIRIMWLPRWSTDEGNCSFFDYKDILLEYVEESYSYELLFRPHPQAFLNFIAQGEMSEEDIQSYKKRYEDSNNCAIDIDEDYWSGFASTDIILADATSLLAEAFLTEKPIIYCHKEKDVWTKFGKSIYEGFYVASCWNDIVKFLEQLKNGMDPLLEKRKKIISNIYDIPTCGAGIQIKDYLKEEFRK